MIFAGLSASCEFGRIEEGAFCDLCDFWQEIYSVGLSGGGLGGGTRGHENGEGRDGVRSWGGRGEGCLSKTIQVFSVPIQEVGIDFP